MRLNEAGRMVKKWWAELNRKFPNVQTDEYIVMPNHFHGIIVITPVGADLCVCPNNLGAHAGAPLPGAPVGGATVPSLGQTRRSAPTCAPLPEIVQWFKTMTTNGYIPGVKTSGWLPVNGRLWQRNYYEHVIRTEDALNRIPQYILDNPARWAFDRENPQSLAPEPENVWAQ